MDHCCWRFALVVIALLAGLTLTAKAAEAGGAADSLNSYLKPDAFANVVPDFSMAAYRNGAWRCPTRRWPKR